MIRKYIALGRISGISIALDYSWFLIFFLLTWILATNYFPLEIKGGSSLFYWGIGVLTSILFFISVLLHELGHSFLARQYEIQVKKITLFIFGGVAEIKDEPPNAKAEFWIALAGPIVSFFLAGIFYFLGQISVAGSALWVMLSYLALINFILAGFNLIPGFPLDGGRIFRAFLWGMIHNFRKATMIAANTGRFIAYGFIVLGIFLIISGKLFNGLWLAFIGWFLESAAVAQIHQQTLHDLLASHNVKDALLSDIQSVSSNTSVQDLIDHHIIGRGHRYFLVRGKHKPLGLLTIHRIKEIPHDKRKETNVSEIMIPEAEVRKVNLRDNLWDSLKEMNHDGVNQLLVMEDHKITGILSREGILSFIRDIQEL
jgi:Zn-dependent protease/CBS domain-containing protein